MRFKILTLALGLYSCAAIALDATETAGWYFENYGIVEECEESSDVDTENAEADDCMLVKRTKDIFKKVKRSSVGVPIDTDLYVINARKVFAIALPDGNIVVSIGALKLARRKVDNELGDARIAFILGHELAHQANRDFWIENYNLSGTTTTLPESFVHNASQFSVRHDKEIKADEAGFINASLAGFRTDRLVSSNEGNQSFIEFWVDQTGTVNSATHPDPKSRSSLLRTRLSALESKAEIFKYGVRLAHFGRYHDARELLLEFERDFPSREVHNNLGYVYLQMARQEMPSTLAYRFWYPTLLETNIGLHRHGGGRSWITDDTMPERATELLEKAREYLERAVKMDREDIVSRVNLVAVNLYLGKTGTAWDIVDKEITKLRPGDAQLMGLRALVLYLLEPKRTWYEATMILEPLSRLPGIEHNVVYNYSRLMQERPRDEAAEKSWVYLAKRLNEIPPGYQRAICKETTTSECDEEPSIPENSKLDSFWVLPLQHGADVDAPASQDHLSGWHDAGNIQVGTTATRVMTSTHGDTMLALDNEVELAALKRHPFKSTRDLVNKMGKPGACQPLSPLICRNDTDWPSRRFLNPSACIER